LYRSKTEKHDFMIKSSEKKMSDEKKGSHK